jgi:prepilin-type processing-associated H-X9-DG protein
MRMHRLVVPLLFAGILAAPAVAETTTASTITPYVDNQTLLAARLDVSRIDTNAIESLIDQLFAEQHMEMTDDLRRGMSMGKMAADAMLARFKALGGDRVYVLISFPDVWPALQPLAVLIPVAPSGDVNGMAAMVNSLPWRNPASSGGGDDGITVAPLNDHLLFAGSTAAFKRLQAIHAQPRPELEGPLSESSSALTAATAPTMDVRRVVAEMMPRLPEEIGGQSTEALARNLMNVTLRLDLPPKPELTLTAQTGTSEEAAKLLADLANRGITAAREESEFKHAFGPGGSQAALAPQVNGLLDALKPTVSPPSTGGQSSAAATVHLSSEQIHMMATLLAPALAEARERAVSAASMSNLHQIGLACTMYSNDKNQAWPASFDDLKPYLHGEQMLINPNDPQHRRYILEPWSAADMKRLGSSANTIPIAYEAGDDPQARVNVLYYDGHVERLNSRQELTAQLAKAHAQAAK